MVVAGTDRYGWSRWRPPGTMLPPPDPARRPVGISAWTWVRPGDASE